MRKEPVMAKLDNESLQHRIDRYKAKVRTYPRTFSSKNRIYLLIAVLLLPAAWTGLIYWINTLPTSSNTWSAGQALIFLIATLVLLLSIALPFFYIGLGALLEFIEHVLCALIVLPPLWFFQQCRRAFSVLFLQAVSMPRIYTIRKRRHWYKMNPLDPKLCDKCRGIVTKSKILNGSIFGLAYPVEKYRHLKITELTSSALQCHLCNLLLNSALQRWSIKLPSGMTEKNMPEIEVELKVSKIPRGCSSVFLKLHCEGIPGDVTLAVDEIHKNATHIQSKGDLATSLPHVMAWARNCITSCKDEHIICLNSTLPVPFTPFRPTRLLRIEKEEPQSLRLVDMNKAVNESEREINIKPPTRDEREINLEQGAASAPEVANTPKFNYLALTHRWGGEIDARLLKSNISQMMESIDMKSLPKNFQHALSITRQLGYEHLWIDSLCIIQDDESDWEQESAKMGLVYSYATCVISAISAVSSTGGCFFPKNPAYQDVNILHNAEFTLTIRSWIREGKMLEKLFEEYVEQAPLTSRGWAFQERLLAKRVLHFSRGGLLFECSTHRASEYHEEGIPHPVRTSVRGDGKLHSNEEIQRLLAPEEHYECKDELVYHSGIPRYKGLEGTKPYWRLEKRVVKNLEYKSQREKVSEIIRLSAHLGMRGSFEMLLRFAGTSTIEKLELHNSWFEMIEQYSTRTLTKSSDNLMAIIGVVALVQQARKLTFIAGLWKEALEFNLLWSTTPIGRRSDRPLPSWSWASIDGPVHHHLKTLEASVLTMPQLDASGKPTGLESSPKPAGISNTKIFESSWQNIFLYISAIEVNSVVKIGSLIHNATLRLTCQLLEGNALAVGRITFLPDIAMDEKLCTLLYMPVVSFQKRVSESTISAPELHGLVVRKTPDDTVERVGYFWTTDGNMITKITAAGVQHRIVFV